MTYSSHIENNSSERLVTIRYRSIILSTGLIASFYGYNIKVASIPIKKSFKNSRLTWCAVRASELTENHALPWMRRAPGNVAKVRRKYS